MAAPAGDRGSALDPSTVLSLQRTAGNASVTRALGERRALQRYGTPIPTVASPSVRTMREYIDLIKRVEAASPGRSALQLATLIMRSKYNSQGFDWLCRPQRGRPA